MTFSSNSKVFCLYFLYMHRFIRKLQIFKITTKPYAGYSQSEKVYNFKMRKNSNI